MPFRKHVLTAFHYQRYLNIYMYPFIAIPDGTPNEVVPALQPEDQLRSSLPTMLPQSVLEISPSTNSLEGPAPFVSLITITTSQAYPSTTNECSTGSFSSPLALMAVTGLCLSLTAIGTTVCLILGCVVLHGRRSTKRAENNRKVSNTYEIGRTRYTSIYVLHVRYNFMAVLPTLYL